MLRPGVDLFRPTSYVLAAALGFLVLMPLLWIAYYSVTEDGGAFTFANFAGLVTDPSILEAFWHSVIIAVGTGILCCVIAVPLAWCTSRTDLPARRLIRILVMASFVTPPFLGAIAWEILAAPNSGLINELFRYYTGQPRGEHIVNIYTIWGLIFVISCYTFPYVYTLVANALDRVPTDLEEASSILGAHPYVTLRKVTIPLVLPALLAGSLIAMLQALTMFGAPAILALPAGFDVATTKIWSFFQFPPDLNLASAASLPLLLVAILLLQGKSVVLGRKGYTVLGGKSGVARITLLRHWKPLATLFAFCVVSLTVIIPYLALLKTAVTPFVTDLPTWSNLTLVHIKAVFFGLSDTRLAIWNTFFLGILTATITTVIATLVAYMVSRKAVRGARFLEILATVPIAIPGIVLGVGFFIAYTQPAFRLYGTLWILLLAFTAIALPAAYQQMLTALKGVHTELEDAARILGENRLSTLLHILGPLLRASVVATWSFVFVGTIRELSAAILLTTANTKLISVMIYDLNEMNRLGSISVLGILLLTISFLIIWLATYTTGNDPLRQRLAK
ncbi:ABC transporter permease [Castellaniella sp. UC4442_H9]